MTGTPSIAISTPVPTVPGMTGPRTPMLTWDWVQSRLQLIMPTGHDFVEIRIVGKKIAEAREDVAEKAVELGVKYLFFLDWDVLPPPETLDRLVYLADNNPTYDVFSGLYCTKAHPAAPLIFREWGQGVDYNWTVGDLLDCVGVPAGCMLIRVGSLARVDRPWFHTDGGTEDLWFCKRVAAAGGKIMLDTAVQCGHIDNMTGIIYTLAHDTLPWKRWKEKHR